MPQCPSSPEQETASCAGPDPALTAEMETSSLGPAVRSVRLVALDSSQLGDLARDWFSPDPARRLHARRFHNGLTAQAAVPFLCFHHVEELLQHENDAVVSRRLSFLSALPSLAWVRPADGRFGMGTIVDVLAWEARTALDHPSLGAESIGAAAKPSLIAFGTGAEAMAPLKSAWPVLAALARERAAKSREIVAITGGAVPAAPDVRVSQLCAGTLRNPLEAQRSTVEMQERLAADIASRGDRRIADPHSVAEGFFERVRGEALSLYAPSSNPIIEDLRRRGIEDDDVADDPTMGELIELMEYRGKLRTVTEACGLDCAGLQSRASMRRLPAWMIERGLRTFGQRRMRNAGGDLTDRHLACLAPYADLLIVDRRTAEDVRRARAGDAELVPLLSSVSKAGPYRKVIATLEGARS